ncbi:MAG TPA: hypothetical protein VGM41_03270 [Chitinophagaceae bacterium]
MKNFLFSLAITCFFFSCKNQPAGNDAPSTDSTAAAAADSASSRPDTTETASFFPVPDYIGGQLRYVDSLQLPLTKSVTVNGKTSLVSLPDAEFRRLAGYFRKPDINDPVLKRFYKETSLADQSIPSVTLSYTTDNPDLEIRKIDVIIQPDPVRNDRVRTIYMEKIFRANDTIVRQKLYWRANHNFQIITEKQIGKTLLPAEQVKAVWDPTDAH